MVRPQPRRAPERAACAPAYSWLCAGPTDPRSSHGVERTCQLCHFCHGCSVLPSWVVTIKIGLFASSRTPGLICGNGCVLRGLTKPPRLAWDTPLTSQLADRFSEWLESVVCRNPRLLKLVTHARVVSVEASVPPQSREDPRGHGRWLCPMTRLPVARGLGLVRRHGGRFWNPSL